MIRQRNNIPPPNVILSGTQAPKGTGGVEGSQTSSTFEILRLRIRYAQDGVVRVRNRFSNCAKAIMLVACLLTPTLAQAQSQSTSITVTKADAMIRVNPDLQSISVDIQYTLDVGDEVTQIPFKGYLFEYDRAQELCINVNGTTREATAGQGSGLLDGFFEITSPADSLVGISYTLTREPDADIRTLLPLVFIDAPGSVNNAQLFSASVMLPDGYYLHDVFPTVDWDKEETANTWHFELQTVPSAIKIGASTSEPGLFSGLLWVDLLVGGILIVFLGLAWKKTELGS